MRFNARCSVVGSAPDGFIEHGFWRRQLAPCRKLRVRPTFTKLSLCRGRTRPAGQPQSRFTSTINPRDQSDQATNDRSQLVSRQPPTPRTQQRCAHAPTSNTHSIAPMPAASSASSFTDSQMYPSQPIIVILAAVLSFTGTTAAHPESGSGSGTVPASTPAYSKATTPMAAVITSCVKPNTIALTFDDGPFIYMYVPHPPLHRPKACLDATAGGTLATCSRNTAPERPSSSASCPFSRLLRRLTKQRFSTDGNNYDCIYSPDVVGNLRYAFEAGHQIASHTWSHPNLEKCSSDEIHSEITLLNTALLEILGIKTQFIRPPYGNYNTLVRQVVAQYNMSLVVWDFDSGDSVGEAWPDSEKDYEAEFEKHVTNLIALNHETEVNTVAEVVPWVLPELLSKGYKPVTVAECLGVEPYTFVGSFGERDSSWTCKKD
ncbi:Chitin deacetylase [Mycena chlorophos]|uniref:Chitin deacetylase n=1 Tax=Mycena chlorophos TaxID=658473 RepID=A0A8H6TI82_MYCCL|nr:Chitin deacetylase [Mycena chlorophos]